MAHVTSKVVGGTTHNSARVVAQMSGSSSGVTCRVADNDGLSSATDFGPETPDAQDMVYFDLTGLDAGTRHWYALVQDATVENSADYGQFLTHPGAPDSEQDFRFGFGFCAGANPAFPAVGSVLAATRISNHPGFDAIRLQALAEDWAMYLCLGDLHYYDLGSGNHGIGGGASVGNYRRAYEDVLLQPRQHQLYREVPWMYMWHDHGYGPNNSDGTHTGKNNASQVYRERVPHHPLEVGGSTGSLYHSVQIGRVLMVLWDDMFNRSPAADTDNASKTMLGSAQKTWFDGLLAATSAEALVIVTGDVNWNQTADAGNYSWRGYTTERAELVDMVLDNGFGGKTAMLKGDAHRTRLDSGANNPNGGWPVLVGGPIDSNPSGPNAANYDRGGTSVRGSYGVVDVKDRGSAGIAITLAGYTMGRRSRSYTLQTEGRTIIPAGNPSHVLAL